MNMLDELKKIGLSEYEAKVYLALLELGSATAQEIATKSGIKRTTIYVQIEALMKMGLVTSFEKETKNKTAKTFFRAEDPEHLKSLVENEKRQAEEHKNLLNSVLPGLGSLYLSQSQRPRVRFFEGLEGLKTMQDAVLKTKTNKKEIIGISSVDDILTIFPKQADEYIPRRVALEINSKLIYTSTQGHFLKETDKQMLRESHFVEPSKFPFSVDLNIYGDITAISALRGTKPFGVIIESKEIADSMRAVFNLAWEGTK